jgi:hypothetical protein
MIDKYRMPYQHAARFKPKGGCYCDLSDQACYAAGHWRPNLPFPNPHIAVFNAHVNDAGTRALREVKNMFPTTNRHLRALARMDKSGIMEIFNVKPTGPSREYAYRVFAHANGLPLGIARAYAQRAR